MRKALPLLWLLLPMIGAHYSVKEPPPLYRFLGNAYIGLRAISSKLDNPARVQQMIKMLSQENVPDEFPCDPRGFRSPSPPTSVHKLMPGDIDVVGALGDSITAGAGSLNTRPAEFLLDDRGDSYCIGGDEDWKKYLTLPNILKLYNPNVYGYSSETTFSYHRKSKFNIAVNGVPDDDLPYEAMILKKRMVNDPNVDFENHWKVITINIGVNDLCSYQCYDDTQNEEDHRRHLEEALDYLKDNFPRTLVNLVHVFDVMVYRYVPNPPLRCYISQRAQCSCVVGLPHEKEKVPRTREMERAFWMVERELVDSGRYDGKKDFAVVLQPFSMSMFQGRTPEIYAFAIDCFHYSQKGHARAANSLWNNMLEPVGNKTKHWVQLEFSRFLCPTRDSPYFFTKANSR